jgi:hypothetical protein
LGKSQDSGLKIDWKSTKHITRLCELSIAGKTKSLAIFRRFSHQSTLFRHPAKGGKVNDRIMPGSTPPKLDELFAYCC